jgi:hypothetical protein
MVSPPVAAAMAAGMVEYVFPVPTWSVAAPALSEVYEMKILRLWEVESKGNNTT